MDIQDTLLRLNFNQMLPKIISDKVLAQFGSNKDEKNKGLGQGKNNGKHLPSGNQDKQDIVYDNDKSHQHWQLKEKEFC